MYTPLVKRWKKDEKSEGVKPGSWRLEVHHLLQAGVGGDSSSFTTTTTLSRGQGVYPEHQSPWTTRTAAIEVQMFFWRNTFMPHEKGGFWQGFWEVCFWMLLCLHRRSGKKYISWNPSMVSPYKIINILPSAQCEEAETQNEPSGEKHFAFLCFPKDLLFCGSKWLNCCVKICRVERLRRPGRDLPWRRWYESGFFTATNSKKLDHFPNNSRHSTDPVYSHMLILWNLLCLDCVSLLVLDFSFPTKPYLSRPEKRRQTSNLIYAWRTLARSRGHAARHGAQWR